MYLAKIAATADVISGGRVEMGIGGGWYEQEWLAYGYGFPTAGERLAMLDGNEQTDTATVAGTGAVTDIGVTDTNPFNSHLRPRSPSAAGR